MKNFLVMVVVALSVAAAHGRQSDRDRELARKHLRAGQEAFEIERWEQAERDFTAALKLDPTLDLAHYGLGQVYMATKRYPRAVQAFTYSRDVFGRNVAADLSNRLADEQRLDDRIRELKDVRRNLESGRIRSQNTAASVHQYSQQISQLEALRHRNPGASVPTPPYILTALGSAYFRSGAFADAEREWRAGLAVDPTIGELHNNVAVVCMLTERYDEAAREIALAEKLGFRVSPGLKEDLAARRISK
jgi:tetratricopeptide (TPR) repeat protein